MKQPTRIAIAGAGIAALRVAQELRALGATGEIIMVGDEDHLPYDRPPLSKAVLSGTQAHSDLTTVEELASLDISLVYDSAVKRFGDGVLETEGSSFEYDALVVATGASPKRLSGLSNVHYLRTHTDARAIFSSMRRTRSVVVIGGGFIGCEVASTARTMGIDATIVEPAPFPLVQVLGSAVAAEVANIHDEAGVALRTGVSVARQTPNGSLVLSDGSTVYSTTGQGQTIVAGVGASPNSDSAKLSGLPTTPTGHVRATATGRTALDGVWALGDVAAWSSPNGGARQSGVHWTQATTQAPVVARDILGLEVVPDPAASLEYFWSDQHRLKLQLMGSTDATDEVAIIPSRTDHRIVAVYGKSGSAAAVFGISRARVVMGARALLASGASYDEVVNYALQEMP